MAMAAPLAMIMAPRIAMPTADLLRLTQLLSAAFPVGAFAYSQGLEVAMVTGVVQDANSLHDWAFDTLMHGNGRMDAILLAHARQGGDLGALAALARALAPSAERLQETLDQGRAFGRMVQAITGQTQPDLPYPVAVGMATRGLEVPTATVLALWLQGQAAMLCSAAQRFVPLGAGQAQSVQARLAAPIANLAKTCATAPLSALSSSTVLADIASMAHETLQPRIFRT